jgi:hypothetical protein
VIKHNVAKFIGHYGTLVAFCEFGTLVDYILHKTLELYKSKQIKIQCFVFLYCWFLLKYVLRILKGCEKSF